MILNNAPQDQAVLSNVGHVGEFRIRNSAKAFSILSSGLYANKIRAIIRELSCNAVDSHKAAGKESTPYDVHLPNTIEPWFSIRDYGTGLDSEQVKNIYTTYFESTKTDSNDFIGALGLGSKSPFSYTNNFTVTAIKDGVKGIYTAFINEQGIPSIALMTEAETTEPNGVEVKFSVSDRYDFDKFRVEAQNVYMYFKDRPVITGVKDFTFPEIKYEDRDIVPGISTAVNIQRSMAIMGNIAYPIDIPSNSIDNELRDLLNCGLIIEFGIGELDFQASREGLSYVDLTIESIKKKLLALQASLYTRFASEADAIGSVWQRADFIQKKYATKLWQSVVRQYVKNTNFVLGNSDGGYGILKTVSISAHELDKKYNISVRIFNKYSGDGKCKEVKLNSTYDKTHGEYLLYMNVYPATNVRFVLGDTKIGCFERAKYHFRNTEYKNNLNVYVLTRIDKSKDADFDGFLKALHNPPADQVIKASLMVQEQRDTNTRSYDKIGIMQLDTSYNTYQRSKATTGWQNAGVASDYDDNKTYYYVELNAYEVVSDVTKDVRGFARTLSAHKIFNDNIYGVRKSDIAQVRKKSNWVEFFGHIRTLLEIEMNDTSNYLGMVKNSIGFDGFFKFSVEGINPDSPYMKFYNTFSKVEPVNKDLGTLKTLLRFYKVDFKGSAYEDLLTRAREQLGKLKGRYPLISALHYSTDTKDVVEYINLIDAKKGY